MRDDQKSRLSGLLLPRFDQPSLTTTGLAVLFVGFGVTRHAAISTLSCSSGRLLGGLHATKAFMYNLHAAEVLYLISILILILIARSLSLSRER